MLWAKTNASLAFLQMTYINHAEGTLTPSQKSLWFFSLISRCGCIHIYLYVYIYIYMCVYIYKEMRGLAPEKTDYVRLYVSIFAFIHIYIYVCTYIERQIHTHIYLYTYKHI